MPNKQGLLLYLDKHVSGYKEKMQELKKADMRVEEGWMGGMQVSDTRTITRIPPQNPTTFDSSEGNTLSKKQK